MLYLHAFSCKIVVQLTCLNKCIIAWINECILLGNAQTLETMKPLQRLFLSALMYLKIFTKFNFSV